MFGRWPKATRSYELANNYLCMWEIYRTIRLQIKLAESQKQSYQVKDDPQAAHFPFAAHIRKTNPRDETTDTGRLSDSLARRILSRGIPYFETG